MVNPSEAPRFRQNGTSQTSNGMVAVVWRHLQI